MPRIATAIINDLKNLENKSKAVFLHRFFRTGKGEYAEGDLFLGITVPVQRKIAVRYWPHATLEDLEELLASPLHEVRLVGLVIMTLQMKKSDVAHQKELYNFYLNHSHRINNWDLVDISATQVIGNYILQHPELEPTLFTLAKSNMLWERRISIVSTFAQLRTGRTDLTFQLAEKLLGDQQDLMHKAVGWLLREAGKRDVNALKKFLDNYAATMPRTALRYALEKFDPETKQYYMKLKGTKIT